MVASIIFEMELNTMAFYKELAHALHDIHASYETDPVSWQWNARSLRRVLHV